MRIQKAGGTVRYSALFGKYLKSQACLFTTTTLFAPELN